MSQAIRPDHHWGRAVTHNFTEIFSSHRLHRFSFYTLAVEILQEVKILAGIVWKLNEPCTSDWYLLTLCGSHQYHSFVWEEFLQSSHFHFFSSSDMLGLQCLKGSKFFYADLILIICISRLTFCKCLLKFNKHVNFECRWIYLLSINLTNSFPTEFLNDVPG